MNLRTSYFVTVMASALVVFSSSQFIDSAIAAEPLKITGPEGETRQVNRQYGPTTSSDTFWSIAQKMRPDPSISIYQVMAAIYDANPHAFSSKNFNSLEKGMILLIPSKEAMLAIPKSLAKRRAERDDRSWSDTAPKAKVKTVKAQEVKPKAETKVVDDEKLKELAHKLELAQSRNLALTDELARAQDKATVSETDFAALQKQTDELKDKVAMLEESLQAVKQQNAELQLLNHELKRNLAEANKETPSDLWRTLIGNPLYIGVATAVPALLLLGLLWVFLRRRRDKDSEAIAQEEAGSGEAGVASADDDSAVQLDMDDSSSSIDDILGTDDNQLKPESDLAADEADLFVESEEEALDSLNEEDDEGQSLDDLWAEAMGDDEPMPADEEEAKEEPGEFDGMLDGLEDEAPEEDIDSLLAGLDIPDEQAIDNNADADEVADEPVQSDSDEFAGLANDLDKIADENIEQLTAAAEAEDLQAAIAAELDTDDELQNSVIDDDDIDALMAGLDSSEPSESKTEDDFDALMANTESPAGEEIDLQSDIQNDDIDSLLAELDSDVADITAESAASEAPASDDIDAMLADLDMGSVDETANTAEALEKSDDDIDAMLSDLDMGSANELEEATEAVETKDDIDAMLADLDAGLVDEKADASEMADASGDVDAMLADLDAGLVNDTAETVEASDDIDAMLADLDVASDISDTQEDSKAVDPVDELLANIDSQEKAQDDAIASKETGFFNDLKANKSDTQDSNMLEWESPVVPAVDEPVEEVISAEAVAEQDDAQISDLSVEGLSLEGEPSLDPVAESLSDELSLDPIPETKVESTPELAPETEIKDEDLLAAFAENIELDDSDANTAEDDFVLDAGDVNLTVDEALAALDAETKGKQAPPLEHDLTSFQQENGFIDIDKLLNDASEGEAEADPYQDIDMDMGDLNSLMGSGEPVDVDDEENSVNAKLDLARAYIEIDDKDSAKALLQEVAMDGNERQQAEADILLKDMG